jgi:hypothetical protein
MQLIAVLPREDVGGRIDDSHIFLGPGRLNFTSARWPTGPAQNSRIRSALTSSARRDLEHGGGGVVHVSLVCAAGSCASRLTREKHRAALPEALLAFEAGKWRLTLTLVCIRLRPVSADVTS